MDNSEITAEEFAQYDRQIRLWGLDAQKRLRQSRVLVVGIGGLASEVVKNIVLAGVKAITLLDDKNVTENDMGSQLLVTHEDIGTNRAEASKLRTQELNPNVIVSADTTPIYNKKEHFFKEFDIVCLTEVPLDLRLKINHICRMEGIKYFCGDVFGFYGYCFADLGMHEFVREEVKKADSLASGDPAAIIYDIDEKKQEEGEPDSKKRREDGKKNEEDATVLVKVTEEYCSLEESFLEDWTKRTRKSMKQSSFIFFIIQVIDRFRKITKRLPSFSEEDKILLLQLKKDVLSDSKVAESFLPEDFSDFCVSELNPVCAITGGVLGQEIIKAASQRDATHNNYFFFNGRSYAGIVDQICPPPME